MASRASNNRDPARVAELELQQPVSLEEVMSSYDVDHNDDMLCVYACVMKKNK